MKKQPKLTLVGAGPGDPDLITLKGVKALNQADVVLYDALVNESLLQHAPKATLLFVGKRLGCHAYTQDEINQLIVDNALSYGHVVRLKGGDPFVFGRGTFWPRGTDCFRCYFFDIGPCQFGSVLDQAKGSQQFLCGNWNNNRPYVECGFVRFCQNLSDGSRFDGNEQIGSNSCHF
jgi:hypothetical protein